MRMMNVTAEGKKARAMRGAGRNGDTEMAHVTPGEIVVPHSVQTPRVRQTLAEEFASKGIPPERYVVRSSSNSNNPETGAPEYFSLGKLAKVAVGAAKGYATGGWAGAALGAAGGMVGGEAGGGGSGAGAAYPQEANPLPQPTKAFVQSGGLNASPKLSKLESLSTMSPPAEDIPFEADMTSSIAPAQVPGAMPVLRPMYAGDAIPSRRINPMTGAAEYFDEKSSVNPDSGMQEFADTLSAAQVNEFLRANNLGGDATKGTARAAIAAAPEAVRALWQSYSSVPGGATAVAPNTSTYAPSSPKLQTVTAAATPAATAATPAAASATSAAGSAATPAAAPQSSETITGIYYNPGNSFGFGNGYRVVTNTGKIYNAVQDATGKVNYTPATDLKGYSQPMNTGSKGQQSSPSAVTLGNARYGSTVSVGGQVAAPAPKTEAAPVTEKTVTETPVSTTTTNTTNNTATTQPDNTVDKSLNQADRRQFDVLNSQVESLRNQLSARDSSTTSTQPVAADTVSDEPLITRTSTLSPERTDRFKSRTREGGMARNF